MSAGLVDVVHRLEGVFDAHGVRRSYGGAIAYNYYGPPRLTQDVDVLVLLPRSRVPAVLEALARAGCTREEGVRLDLRSFLDDLDRKESYTVLSCSGVRVEVFGATLPLHHRILAESVRKDLGGRSIPIHSPEHLIVMKMVFGRPKDIQDIKGVLLAQGDRIDRAKLRSEARSVLEDPTYRELEALLDRYP